MENEELFVGMLKMIQRLKDSVIHEIESICLGVLEDRFDDVIGVDADVEQNFLIVYVLGGGVTHEELRVIGRRAGFRKVMGRNTHSRSDTDVIKV